MMTPDARFACPHGYLIHDPCYVDPCYVDARRVDLCGCDRFKLWYVEDHEWCVCAHARDEHITGRGTCTGEIEVRR